MEIIDFSRTCSNLGIGECGISTTEALNNFYQNKCCKEKLSSVIKSEVSVQELLDILHKLDKHNEALQELEDLNKKLKDDIFYFDTKLAVNEWVILLSSLLFLFTFLY